HLFCSVLSTVTSCCHSLALHAALPISPPPTAGDPRGSACRGAALRGRRGYLHRRSRLHAAVGLSVAVLEDAGRSAARRPGRLDRSEEHTSELQSREILVCRLLLENK